MSVKGGGYGQYIVQTAPKGWCPSATGDAKMEMKSIQMLRHFKADEVDDG